MAETGLRFASPALQAAGLGLSPDPRSTFAPQLAAIGPDQLAPNAADAALIGQPAPPTSQFSSPGTLLPPSSSPRLRRERELRQQREAAAPAAPNILYSPSLGRFSVGGREFGREDYDIALQSQQYLDQPNQPTTPAADWQRIDPAFYQQYISSISEGRGFFGNLGVGAQNVGEGLVGGVGRGLQMLGAEGAGQALVNVGEAIGLSPAEEARSAAISQNQGLLGKIGTATLQSAPTLGVSIGAGLAGAAVGGPIGALAGVALSILPMELQSSWEAAEAEGLDSTDPNVQSDILMSTLFKTGVQTLGPYYLTRGFSPALRRVVDQVTRRTFGQRIAYGVGAGALEGSAEALAQITDRVAFDPELRAEFNEADWAALAPLIVNKYGEEALVAFGAGFLLGGPLGALGTPTQAAPTREDTPPRRDVNTAGQTDLLSGASLEPQATPLALPAPPLALPAPPLALPAPPPGPVQGPMIEDFMQGPRIEDFQQGPLQVPFMGPPAPPPAPPGPVQGPMIEDFMQGPLQVPFMGPPAPLPPLQLTPQQQVNIQETRAAERQAAVAEQNRQLDIAQTAQIAQARRESDLLRQRNTELAARRGAAADADVAAQAAQASAERRLATRDRQEAAAAQGAAADTGIAAELATRGTPATRLMYGNLMRAEKRVAAADQAFRAARASGDRARQQQAGAELTAAQEALTRLRARNESELMTAPVAAAPPLLLTPEQRVAPSAPKSDVVSETTVGPEGLTLLHGGKPGLTRDNIKMVRPASEARQGKRRKGGKDGAGVGGLYTTTEEAEARGYAGEDGVLYEIQIAPGTRVARRGSDITRLDKAAIDQYVADGYGVVVGTDPRGRTEHVVVNKAAIESVTPRPETPTPPQGPLPKGVSTPQLELFRAGDPNADPAPDGFMYLADNKAGAQGGARLPIRQATVSFNNLLRVGAHTELDTLFGLTTNNAVDRANAARAAGYDGVAIARNTKGGGLPWTEYYVLNPDTVVFPDTTPPKGPSPKGGKLADQAAAKSARRQQDAAKLKKGDTGAVQEQGAKKGAMGKGPKTSPQVRGEDTKGQEAARAREAQVREEVAPASRTLAERVDALTDEQLVVLQRRLTAVGEPDIDAAIETNPDAVEIILNRVAPRAAPRRTQEQIDADRAREEAARAEAASRTKTEAAARRAAMEAPTPAVTETAEMSPAEEAWVAAQEANPDIELDYDQLSEKEQQRWAGNVRRGEATPRKAREAVKRVLGEGGVAETDAEATLEAIADAEQYVLGARKESELTSEVLDAGVDLFVLRNDPTTPKDQVALIDRILGPDNLTGAQYAKIERLYQQRNEIARLNNDPKSESPETRAAQAGVELLDIVNTVNMGERVTRSMQDRFKELARIIRAAGPRKATDKLQAIDYAKTDGSMNLVKGKIRPIRGFETDGATSLRGYNTLEGTVDMNGKPTKPMPTGKLRMAAQAFVSRLATKPNMFYFKDQADLRARNPELYARADAARPQGDFAEVDAAAYFFGGDNIIIFTDRIASTGHLNTVMAHEIMGHFGIRAVVGDAPFRKVMDAVYKNSTDQARILIDQAVEARGMTRAEATEEYLSDYAARIEGSILQRWWNAVKGALNKLGVRFGDEHARYLLAQARRYATLGQAASAFDAEAMGLRMNMLESGTEPSGDGRFARANERIASSAINAARLIETSGIPRPKNLDDALARVQDYAKRNVGVNFANFYDGLKSQVFTPTLWRSIRNEGFNRVWTLVRERYNIARTHINRMQVLREKTLRPAVETFGLVLSGGLTMQSRSNVGKALKAARIFMSYGYKRGRKAPKLFRFENGEYRLQDGSPGTDNVLENLKAMRPTREQFKEGIDLKFDIAVPLTPEIRAQIEAERDVEIAAAKTDAERKRIEAAYAKRLSDTSYTDTYEEKFAYDFTDDEWTAFNAELDSMAETSVELLRSQLQRFDEEQDTTYKRIRRAMDAPLTDGDRALIQRLVNKFTDITIGSAEYDERGVRKQSSLQTRRAEAFIATVNKALLAPDGETRPLDNLFSPDAEGANGQPFFEADERTEIEAAIRDFRTRYKPKKPEKGKPENPARFVVQQEVRSLANERIVMQDAEAKAVQDIETGYVPFFREGGWQVRMAFIGADGREYAMTDRYRDQTAYFQFDSQGDAEGAVPGLTELFDPDGETTYDMEVTNPETGEAVIMTGKLVPQVSAVITTATTDPELNFNESMRFLRRFNLHPDPARAEQIILALTSQNDRAILRQLRAAFVAGSENDLTQAISQHIESRASTIARNRTNVRLANALDLNNPESRKLWYGDRDEYNRRKAAWEAAQADPNMSADAKHQARLDFDTYHSWYKTNDAPKRGGSYYNEARKLVTFLDQQKQVLETDMASNPVVERLRTTTAVSFLMSSIASGALNIVGLFTNVPAALATYNARNAYGGGFGWDGFAEVFRALTTVGMSLKPGGLPDTAEYWAELSDADLKKKGMTREEADFLAEGIAGGFLDAAQFNSLTGSARGRVTSGRAQKFVEWAMLPFNTTEQTSRRAAALAAFRLEFNRRVNAGESRVDAAKNAALFAENIVSSTLGDYTTANRPAFFRGGIQQFAFMFKQFVVNSATLLANLPWKGKVIMLGSLLLLAGLRGIPFAEDIEDLVDALAAKFGIPVPSIREYMVNKGNEFIPGFGNLLMSGAFNQFIGTDFGARTGLGNIVPGTEAFLPGADMSRVLTEVGGPMVSFAQSALTTMGNVLDFAPGGKPGDLETLLREQPISILRAWGDAYAYQRSGAIIDRRGYVVSDEYNAGVALMRMLGFYPLSASREYDIVRIGKRRTEYLRSYTTAFRDAIVRAEARGDRAEARRLYQQVRDWNRYARGTGLEIEGIREKVQRALKAQRQLASERFIQSTARSVRPYVEAYESMY